jgi:hypothetical protein
MKPTWLWLLQTVALSFGAFNGCGGTSDGGNDSAAGTSSGAGTNSGGTSNSAGTNNGGAGASQAGAGTMNGGASGGGSDLGECPKADCGPQLGLLNWTCADGSVGGPTGRCLKRPSGTCSWEINNCPMPGAGGAVNEGGQANTGGEPSAGGAAPEDCGGCGQGKICVFQAGGPGPSHFICAMQNPCGAAAACACIVGQGTCQPNLMGDPPRYCSCDNGLE